MKIFGDLMLCPTVGLSSNEQIERPVGFSNFTSVLFPSSRSKRSLKFLNSKCVFTQTHCLQTLIRTELTLNLRCFLLIWMSLATPQLLAALWLCDLWKPKCCLSSLTDRSYSRTRTAAAAAAAVTDRHWRSVYEMISQNAHRKDEEPNSGDSGRHSKILK